MPQVNNLHLILREKFTHYRLPKQWQLVLFTNKKNRSKSAPELVAMWNELHPNDAGEEYVLDQIPAKKKPPEALQPISNFLPEFWVIYVE